MECWPSASALLYCVVTLTVIPSSAFHLVQPPPFYLKAAGTARSRVSSLASASTEGAEGVVRRKVVFLGTPDVAALCLQRIHKAAQEDSSGFDLMGVVTNPPAPVGRKRTVVPSPVQAYAEENGLPVWAPDKPSDEAFLNEMEALSPDLCITAAYGGFLPQRFLDIPEYGTLNIHPSLLPKYRGAAPVQRALEAGEAVTGVSVVRTVLKMDAGPVLKQIEYPLTGDETCPQLLHTLFELGTDALLDLLPSVWRREAPAQPQDESLATKARKLTADEGELRFNRETAASAHNKIRAFSGWPGCWSEFTLTSGSDDDAPPQDTETLKMKLLSSRLLRGGPSSASDGNASSAPPSADRLIDLQGDALKIVCFDGSELGITQLQPQSRKAMGAKAFWNGLRGRLVRWVGAEG
ncbi:unnamed protein product [Vitrella brassicaformis CCMP3155]|uniref:Methionyl-tRNA formyltransferase, mitochondrial n=2 Tax=Vitrella brassicaformis TaxID=1169539 RepID=A0A0G4EPG3_VITBC|nr:unnamed protein product [Vitrella brassicaformis CCMP3155]|eukprot:CEL99145.1 unnamed protein product [Vitrella brassicaformis CCMP3155]